MSFFICMYSAKVKTDGFFERIYVFVYTLNNLLSKSRTRLSNYIRGKL